MCCINQIHWRWVRISFKIRIQIMDTSAWWKGKCSMNPSFSNYNWIIFVKLQRRKSCSPGSYVFMCLLWLLMRALVQGCLRALGSCPEDLPPQPVLLLSAWAWQKQDGNACFQQGGCFKHPLAQGGRARQPQHLPMCPRGLGELPQGTCVRSTNYCHSHQSH